MKNQQPIHVFATWTVKEGHIETVLNLLKTIGKETVKESGNLFYKVHQSNTDANTIILFEGYIDENAIAEHRKSAHYQDLIIGQIIPLLKSRDIVLATPIEA
ncbi:MULTISPECIES: putative quinol monooxygenase [unclassified Arcicella]|uniref:putative quinol monooxygenase n=1 Tax=unclassified Arcicella TaxID=2644986 RepID=UPI002854CFA5|nr:MULTISPECIES: putative quinol monooxygenase [unclassified Arcicella]MDR6561779.1 quinol monooxygenase YgiN [Arcicella sp. BE51]MDR6812559.1 quinol monooxygenase YgiN [Arcicella sp. BE140]MDR6823669.1 quinol monooxygenase YgiN [Arcicella sp. BE139]